MTNQNLYIVLMAGGSGTRLWPMSRVNSPKQLHKISSEKSLLKETYDRFASLVKKENIYISLVENILEITQAQIKEVKKENFIIEPEGKNTAPAIALMSAKIFKKNPNAIIAAVPSDHIVNKVGELQETITSAANFLDQNPTFLVTIGIKPTSPETGLGYIQVGKKFASSGVYKVDKFKEKPDQKTAEKYLASKKFLWNGGYYIFKAGEIIKLYEKYAPEIYTGLKEILRAIDTKDEKKVIEKEYAKFSKAPIDTTLSEKVEDIAVVPADLGWSDVGNWASLFDCLSSKKNEVISRGHHIGMDDQNCLIYAQDKLLATVGLKNIVVIDTPDVTLICDKEKSQDVKLLLEKLKEQGKNKYL